MCACVCACMRACMRACVCHSQRSVVLPHRGVEEVVLGQGLDPQQHHDQGRQEVDMQQSPEEEEDATPESVPSSASPGLACGREPGTLPCPMGLSECHVLPVPPAPLTTSPPPTHIVPVETWGV